MDYMSYLQDKTQLNNKSGFVPESLPDFLFDFQKELVLWALGIGRSAIFADCGMGKTPMQLVWAQKIVEKTNKNILILTPLAVSRQTISEGEKFGIEVKQSRDGKPKGKITITNYEQLEKFDSNDFVGVVCDESSILKNFKGTRKSEITRFMRKLEYRLLCTATASPNDFIELGTSSEALGYLGYMDMLGKFFKNEQNSCAHSKIWGATSAKWRLKGHAHKSFWKWVTSWSRAIRKPSDLGFDDNGFNLPELKENEHLLNVSRKPVDGALFTFPAQGLKEVRDERRATIKDRCEYVAEIVNSADECAVVWCNLNDEGDLLEKLIPESVQVSGKDSDDKKEEKFLSFQKGESKILITKPKIGGFGLNWQHCNRVVFFPNYSYEQYYQAVRRCWRFGQKNTVTVDLVYTDGDRYSVENLKRKQKQADEMFTNLVIEMNNSLSINNITNFDSKMEIPKWL